VISFPEWLAVYEPIYGALADHALYAAHTALDIAPDPVRYREAVPQAARKALGEYYTPEWLVARVYDRAGYRGEPVLDPTCGSGAFLAPAGSGATGWDINPLAVRMARAACPKARVDVQDAFTAPPAEAGLIIGNPPWVNWRRLGAGYRHRIAPLWKHYGLFTHTGIKARLGGAMDDLCALVTYLCADRHLVDGGRLAFLLPAPLFQSAGGGAGFRRFELPGGRFLRVVSVEDVDGAEAFQGATTRPAIAVFEKSRTATLYPVPYIRGGKDLQARPIGADAASPWSVGPASRESFDDLRGESSYVARVGAHTGGAAGVFWIDVLEDRGPSLLIRNRAAAGKNPYPEVTALVERDLVHPLVRGRDLKEGVAIASGHILLPHASGGKPIPGDRMSVVYPLTYAYFETFRAALLQRAHYHRHFKPLGLPYWSMYNVGPYTFAPHRVAWREQASSFGCGLLKPGDIADAKLVTLAAGSAAEAEHVASFLNSERVRALIDSYVVRTQVSTHVTRYVRIPPFTP